MSIGISLVYVSAVMVVRRQAQLLTFLEDTVSQQAPHSLTLTLLLSVLPTPTVSILNFHIRAEHTTKL